MICNRNAWKDGVWDAEHDLGCNNQYNVGSASWRAYNIAYAKEIVAKGLVTVCHPTINTSCQKSSENR